jgi:hypothetical protein
VIATRITPEAPYTMPSLAHKFVIGGERKRVQDDAAADASAAMRQLVSEGRIVKHITEKDEKGKFVTTTREQVGPIAFVETTTLPAEKIFGEDLNRALLLHTDESAKQTDAVLDRVAGEYEDAPKTDAEEAIIRKHREFQQVLKPCAVHIPFARSLLKRIPRGRVKARRAGPQVLQTAAAVTLLHQLQRQRDRWGRLIATEADYLVARRVLLQPLTESLGVSASAVRLHGKLREKFPTGKIFSTTDAQALEPDAESRSVRNWVNELAEHGCLEVAVPARGPKPAQWRLTKKNPTDGILPETV